MKHKRYAIAATTAAVVLAGAVVYNISKPKEYVLYFPVVSFNSRTLQSEFAKHGIRFGFSVSSGSFENPITRNIIQEHAAVVTTENALKTMFTQPMPGVYDFGEGDAIVARANELGIDVHGHTASWSLQNPAWLIDGAFSYSELEYILSNHVSTLAKHYDGKLISMDAANEGFLGCGPWCPLGTNNYVHISFDAARKAHPYPEPDGPEREPTTPLIYNSIFPNRTEEDKTLSLLDAGTIDGIGIQLHLTSTLDWQAALDRTDAFLARIRKHGGYARFSEVGVWAISDEEQATVYAAVTALAVKHQDIVRDVVVWGIKDPSWRGNVTLFDTYGEPKASYYAVMEELRK